MRWSLRFSVGLDLPDLWRDLVGGRFEIELRLDVHSECRSGAEELAEPQRGVGSDRRHFIGDAFNAGTRHANLGRNCIGRQLERLHEFLTKDFARVNRRELLCHERPSLDAVGWQRTDAYLPPRSFASKSLPP